MRRLGSEKVQLDQIGNLEFLSSGNDGVRRPWTVQRVYVLLKRQRWAILVPTLLLSVIGVAYVLQREPTYTARGRLLLENVRFEAGRQELLPTMNTVETSMLESQAELLKSETFALKVIERLGLEQDPEFTRQSGLLHRISQMAGLDGLARQAPSSTDAVLADFESRLKVQRVGPTSILEIGFRAGDAPKAAQIVNELIQIYIADQTAATAAAAASASAWLRERIKELGARSRIVDVARPPIHKDGPGRLALLAAFAALGGLLGCAAAVLRETLDTALRYPWQAREVLGGTCFGAIATFSRRESPRHRRGQAGSVAEFERSINFPGSDLASVVRRIKTAGQSVGPVIGVRCTVPGEGTTTVAANLAYSAAKAGDRVLLIDCNSINTALSKKLTPKRSKGLTDLAAGEASWEEVISRQPGSEIYFIPFGTRDGHGSTEIPRLIRKAGEAYDLVVLDLAPAARGEDFWLDAPDGLVTVVEWGRVPAYLVQSSVGSRGPTRSGVLGFVFNKVKPSEIESSTFPLEHHRWKH